MRLGTAIFGNAWADRSLPAREAQHRPKLSMMTVLAGMSAVRSPRSLIPIRVSQLRSRDSGDNAPAAVRSQAWRQASTCSPS